MMTETQKELTQEREKMTLALEKMGKTGYIEKTFFSGGEVKGEVRDGERIKGVIDNYLIDIVVADKKEERDHRHSEDAFFGTINGKDLNRQAVKDIFNKYKDIALNLNNDKIEKANREVYKESVDFMVKGILS
jgi:hypothetical protein